jgi:hypothetical protein
MDVAECLAENFGFHPQASGDEHDGTALVDALCIVSAGKNHRHPCDAVGKNGKPGANLQSDEN